ncbi:MAG: 16S rRNA (uracil(1498)-N(3))-methyltransferase [Leucobacter sp.]
MANLYFNELTPADAFEVGATIEVVGEEARHAVRVSRLRAGERVIIGNGAGVLGEGAVESALKDRFTVVLDRVRFEDVRSDAVPNRPRFVLVQALAKGDRAERAVEQATEFGVDAIVPWQASRSVSRWDGAGSEKATKGVAKWRKVAREAAKQSIRAWVPIVESPATLQKLCEVAAQDNACVVVLHPRGTVGLGEWARTHLLPDSGVTDVYLVVGPEGGLTDLELEDLRSAGAQILLLGETVLRTSSAGPAAIAVLNVTLGRW